MQNKSWTRSDLVMKVHPRELRAQILLIFHPASRVSQLFGSKEMKMSNSYLNQVLLVPLKTKKLTALSLWSAGTSRRKWKIRRNQTATGRERKSELKENKANAKNTNQRKKAIVTKVMNRQRIKRRAVKNHKMKSRKRPRDQRSTKTRNLRKSRIRNQRSRKMRSLMKSRIKNQRSRKVRSLLKSKERCLRKKCQMRRLIL